MRGRTTSTAGGSAGRDPCELREVEVPPHGLPGILSVPQAAHSLVIFAHGSGSSRLSPRNVAVANVLNQQSIATLLFDLLTPAEDLDRANVFDIPLLAGRLEQAIGWAATEPAVSGIPFGLFGASTGAAAALAAAARCPDRIAAVVSRGGRPDLAGPALRDVRAPTLLIVGGLDLQVIELNRRALGELRCEKALEIVSGATHLFPEPGALEAVMDLAAGWFQSHLVPQNPQSRSQ